MENQQTVQENYQFKYTFTEDELTLKSKMLAKAIGDKLRLAEEKKSLVADFNAKIESKIAESNLLSSHINNGYEYIFKTCDVVLDFSTGIKIYYFEGVEVGRAEITKEDHQLKIA